MSSSASAFIPECPVIRPVVVAGRTYRQIIIPKPAQATRAGSASQSPLSSSSQVFVPAADSSTAASPSSSSPTAAQPAVATVAPSAPAPSASLLAAVEEATDPSASPLTRFSVSAAVPLPVRPGLSPITSPSQPQQQRPAAVIDRLQRKHNTIIHIPPDDQPQLPAVIRGADRQSVAACKQELDRLIDSTSSRLPYTHFISLPLPAVEPAFRRFQSAVLSPALASSAGLHPSIFVRPTSLHLTLFMLALPSPALVALAASTLSSLRPALLPLLPPSGLTLSLGRLATMNAHPQRAHVVYVAVKDEDAGGGDGTRALKAVTGALLDGFVQAGLLTEAEVRRKALWKLRRGADGQQQRQLSVLYHMTVINTKHRSAGRNDRRQPVDASAILQQLGQEEWGETRVERCELSQLQWNHQTNFYSCDAAIQLSPS